MIIPHGGKLIDRVVPTEEREAILKRVNQIKTLVLDREKIAEIRNIAQGTYSPLTGFLKKQDFLSVVQNMRLQNNIVWPIPIVLDINENDFQRLKNETEILLINNETKPIALLQEPEFYNYDKAFFVKNVFGTDDKNHPGVDNVYKMKDYLIGGEIKLLDEIKEFFPEYNLSPEQTRRIFENKEWQTIAAFQTRNVPHRGHEFLQKQALQTVDGLFVQPVIGEKKLADFKDEFILGAYQLLIDKFYPKNKVLLGILPLKMRYAGPREALFHALIRKNFGCTHFIVGRDHAGVDDYYGALDAQNIFDNFSKPEIGIEVIKFKQVVWCPNCCEFVFEGSCPHNLERQIIFSGSKIREGFEKNIEIPAYFIRPEIRNLLATSRKPLVDQSYHMKQKNNKKQTGFVLWFTGLSGCGKSSIANNVFTKLKEIGLTAERLEADVIRQSLTHDLDWSKQGRDENIRRVSFVAKMLSKNNVGVVASFISPYKAQREMLRKEIENFILVFCHCPLEVCEKRDAKGLYAKARLGLIKNFTGISDPYEEPENPEIILDTSINDKKNIEKCTDQVISYLKQNKLI